MSNIIDLARAAGMPPELVRYVERNVAAGFRPLPYPQPCNYPQPGADGTGICVFCGWLHAPRGPNAIENIHRQSSSAP